VFGNLQLELIQYRIQEEKMTTKEQGNKAVECSNKVISQKSDMILIEKAKLFV